MTSTNSLGTIGSVASLLAATIYQGNHESNYSLLNIAPTVKYIYTIKSAICMCYKWKVPNLEIVRQTEIVLIVTQLSVSSWL